MKIGVFRKKKRFFELLQGFLFLVYTRGFLSMGFEMG